jgi:hypothetical protein
LNRSSLPGQDQENSSPSHYTPEKQVIFLTSRVHPGESNASWMMKGLMDMLLNPSNPEEVEIVSFLK